VISFEEALKTVMEAAVSLGSERVDHVASCGRILAEDIFSDLDMPPFAKAAMDGFACRMKDIPETLKIIETIPAGKVPLLPIREGECARIMTGAMMPEGADCVLKVENTREEKSGMIRFTGEKTAGNICFQAEDLRTGEKVLEAGTLIQPAHIAVMASVGAVRPGVAKLPRIAILSTGDELVAPWIKPGISKIRDSNGSQLMAQAMKVPACAENLGIAVDDPEILLSEISKGLETHDVLLISGGVSMGDFDFVPGILRKAGVEIRIESIAIQPGKPTVFGRKGNHFIFGLPGNPVSSFILFEVLVKPLLLKMMGSKHLAPELILPMGKDFFRRSSERMSLVPVRILKGEIFPIEYHGSAHIHAYTSAHGIIALEQGITEVKKGEPRHVRLL